MDNNGLSLFAILFLVFLGLSAALIIWMFVSLVHLGDERRQQIVGKACTLSFSGLVGYFLLRTLVVAAYLFAFSLAWYKRKLGG